MKGQKYIFFATRPNGRGTSLFTLPGQMLTSRTAVTPGTLTHGCESTRRRYPSGTVFYSDVRDIRLAGGCYHVKTLIPFSLPDGTALETGLFAGEAIEEYNKISI